MQISMDCSLNIELENSSLKEIISSFQELIVDILGQFIYTVLLSFAERELNKAESCFTCPKCGSSSDYRWKTRTGKQTSLLTVFGNVSFPELQLYCRCCKARKVLSRELLEVEPRSRIPSETIRKLGFIGALTSFGQATKVIKVFGIKLKKMTVWRCAQKLGDTITFGLDSDEQNIGEADGTGIPIRGIKKRGKEIKVFVQLKKGGGCRVAGVSIDKYETGWDKLFSPLLKQFKSFKKFLLVTDGDTSIMKGLGDKVEILFQRCLWHIPHQFKWYGWKDKADRKSSAWLRVMARLIDIVDVTSCYTEDESNVKALLDLKREHYKELIVECQKQGWNDSASYLKNAQANLFRGVENKLNGKTSSHAERVMRTLKMRTAVGKWNDKSALNIIKIRLAHYYNKWEA